MRRMNSQKTTITILGTLSAISLALADDFKTIDGKVYKDATISHVEADGIVIKTKTGISKIYFVELPKDCPGTLSSQSYKDRRSTARPRADQVRGLGSGDGKSYCLYHILRCRDDHHCRSRVCYRPSSFSMKSNDASKV